MINFVFKNNVYNYFSVAAPEIFLWGASRGQNAILRGQKSKNLPKMGDFGHFFLLTGGKWGAEPPTWGPHAPLDAATVIFARFDQ